MKNPIRKAMNQEKLQIATFAAGCFWGVEEAFRKLDGVKSTVVGYTGGDFANPTYEDICSNTTGHAEAVHIMYEPSKLSYEELLNVFWNCHDPTTKNRQGSNIGNQYRSAIFYHTPEQQRLAKESKEKLSKSGKYKTQIMTEIVHATTFYHAEEYHQQYFAKRGIGSCHV